MDFIIEALKPQIFEDYSKMSDEELHHNQIMRQTVTKNPGFPCRISLEDAESGEDMLLFNYVFHDVESPYRASGPIYIRRNAVRKICEPKEVPEMFRTRLISLRGYNKEQMLIFAEVFDGNLLKENIPAAFENKEIEYLHIHNAKYGCWFASAKRI